jgi:septal ring factor EnvC (AmiA/AmiB activator)
LSQIHELKLELAQKNDEKDMLEEKLVSLAAEKMQLENQVKALASKEKAMRLSLEASQTEEDKRAKVDTKSRTDANS